MARAEDVFHHLSNRTMANWPRNRPSAHRLKRCRIVSHRGEHDNRLRLENTLPAFDAAADAGVWGIELDVRWTKDLLPVVFHDPDTRRLFSQEDRIGQMSLSTLKKRHPMVPTLEEVVKRYGKRMHLMMEIKKEPYPTPSLQSERMKKVIEKLSPVQDFHLMSLDPDMFTHFEFLPPATFIPIARVRIDRVSRQSMACGWGGLAGHYLMATNDMIFRHRRLNQGIGTGFADSRRCLYREAARGVDWIFSNRAARMQAICDRA